MDVGQVAVTQDSKLKDFCQAFLIEVSIMHYYLMFFDILIKKAQKCNRNLYNNITIADM